MKESILKRFQALLSVSMILPGLFALAQEIDVRGVVRDRVTSDPLPSANVTIVGTSLGAATDMQGEYVIRNVPPGSYTLRASYLGYEASQVEIDLNQGMSVARDFALTAVTLEGEEVVVTAQARGQNAAINEQLASNRIVSVVSSARIQELPDANAAEAIGRLPGVSVLRSAGEGAQVVIRGLQPKYNAITIDGVRMSSSNAADRSTDLSMISPFMLEGIEVTKSVTPDLDPDVLGGTVNFKLREAGGEREGFGGGFLLQGSYNGLSNASNKFNNYKYVASFEGRFFDNLLGVFTQADLERRNLSSNEFGGSYDHLGSSTTQYIITSLNLRNVPRDRKRFNGIAVFDYKLPDGKITFSNFGSSGITNVQNREESFNIPNNVHFYSLGHSKRTLNTLMNSLSVQHRLMMFEASLNLSHTYSETENPGDWTVTFSQASAGLSQFLNVANLNPQNIPPAANNNTGSTFLNSIVTSNSFSSERATTASLDLETTLSFFDMISTVVKFGGKYRHQQRLYLYDQTGGQGLGLTSARFVDSLIASVFPSTASYINTTSIPILPYADPNFNYGAFLDGDYPMSLPLNYAMLSEVIRFLKTKEPLLAQRNDIAYFHDRFNSTTNDYSGFEDQRALYIMATVTAGQLLTVIPGVRYQNLHTTYTASRGLQNTASGVGGPYFHYDTTLSVNHEFWLPALVIRFRPLSWFDVRLSYTNTIAYPDYNAIVPRIDVSTGGSIGWNNYRLVPSRSRNYDAYFSFYENHIGLFTVGGFLKQIDNLIYPWSFFVSGTQALEYFPPGLATLPPSGTFSVSTYVNNPYTIDDWGLEFDWQTHLWYLPRPLDGLVLNVNYTHVYSRAEYPYTYTRRVGRALEYVDTSFTDRLLYQPNDIVNLSVGYDYRDFSIRLSMLYHTDIFTGPNFWPQLRTTTSAYRRWDISVKQDLPWLGLQLYGDLNNINGGRDISVITQSGFPQSLQAYGMTVVLGLRRQW